MDLTAIATTMPPGRYGARHIARLSVSLASCEATTCCHRACARAVSARRTPWSSPSLSCENTHKTQLLASVYCTFLLAKLSNFVTRKGPPTQLIEATSFAKIKVDMRVARELSYPWPAEGTKIGRENNFFRSSKKSGAIYGTYFQDGNL